LWGGKTKGRGPGFVNGKKGEGSTRAVEAHSSVVEKFMKE